MKNILISSFDMEVGGVERSLINLLENFNYKEYKIDLMLYRHKGDFMDLLPQKHTLLDEIAEYTTFRKSILEVIKDKQYLMALSRILSKYKTYIVSRIKGLKDTGYYQMQLMWKISLPFLPKLEEEYDIAISYLWPHYFVADKVKANIKVAWIHTDYSTIYTDILLDLKMWNKFKYIISISQDCTKAFLEKYPELENKIILMENITSPNFIRKMSLASIEEYIENDKKFKIVSVGRIDYQKGFDNAVKALKLLKDRDINDITWYVIGYGGDENTIRKLVCENNLEDNFKLIGKRINPYPYIKACDLYVQPSRYEGKAVTITEAQILGKPILITKYPTANSQIKDGYDGIITELSVEGIANGIEMLYNNPQLRGKLANNCLNTDFSNSYELNKLYEVFK
jgi:glycosyltransferase involved in cell wall biosynthesis